MPICVAEHLLHDLDVRSGGDGEAGGRMAELVRVQTGDPDFFGSTIEPGPPKDVTAEGASAPDTCEDQVVRRFALYVLC